LNRGQEAGGVLYGRAGHASAIHLQRRLVQAHTRTLHERWQPRQCDIQAGPGASRCRSHEAQQGLGRRGCLHCSIAEWLLARHHRRYLPGNLEALSSPECKPGDQTGVPAYTWLLSRSRDSGSTYSSGAKSAWLERVPDGTPA
jgi:hypothetical protein